MNGKITGVVLSHTGMHGDKFCTNVAVQDPQSGQWRQVRPRVAPNGPLSYGAVHLQKGGMRISMQQDWVPGAHVSLVAFGLPSKQERRLTHPEDLLVDPKSFYLHTPPHVSPAAWNLIVQAFVAPSLALLFPNIIQQGNGKAYVEDGQVLTRSVGHIQVTSLWITEDFDKPMAEFTDASGVAYRASYKDTSIRKAPLGTRLPSAMLRVSLAEGWDNKGTYSPGRCYLMASGIL